MKKIYYLQKHPVKIGDVIEHNGFRATVTEELIELNSELFKVEEHIQPIYFKALKGIKPFTTGRVYKQVDNIESPTTIKLIADDNEEWTIYNWQCVYINESSSYFELTTKAEWDKQELLDEAKRNYPVGTTFESWYQKGKYNTIPKNSTLRWESNVIIVATDEFPLGMATLYKDGKWAEILPLKFTTKDGVDIYGDMKTYLVRPNDSDITSCHGLWKGDSKAKCDKYFYHKENALAYIEKHKEKTLDDYENILLRANVDSINAREVCWFYHTLKGKEPKLYYTNILQLIADDLNDGWVADSCNQQQDKYYFVKHCKKHTIEKCAVYLHQGAVLFKSIKLIEKAKDILGEKIKYI